MARRPPPYRGRFAPSPTGPLHQGSLLAALGSFLDARSHGGEWLLRVEDIDPPREVEGAGDAILRSLDIHGLHWDGPVLYQSTRIEAYEDCLQQLQKNGHVFSCVCTRAILGPGGSCGGRCHPQPGHAQSQRLRLAQRDGFDDFIRGAQRVAATPADLVLKRKDGLFAYALAVVVDDAFQGITHVVRGHDLLAQTPAQLELMSMLSAPAPAYGHLPLLLGQDGHKLSKQTGAAALDDTQPARNLRLALEHLGQAPPPENCSIDELLSFATANWDRSALARSTGHDPVYAPSDRP